MSADLTTEQIDAVTGDDLAYWLRNPFMSPDLLEAKVRYWVTKYADHARREAEAWEEGYRSGFSNAMRRMSDEPEAPTTPNPYRSRADR